MIEPVPQPATGKERISGELAMEIGTWCCSSDWHGNVRYHTKIFFMHSKLFAVVIKGVKNAYCVTKVYVGDG